MSEMTRSPDAARKSQLGHVTCEIWAWDKKLDYLSGNMGIDINPRQAQTTKQKPSAPPDLENGSEGKVKGAGE